MRDPFQRLQERLFSNLGKRALLRGVETSAILTDGVATYGEYGQVAAYRSRLAAQFRRSLVEDPVYRHGGDDGDDDKHRHHLDHGEAALRLCVVRCVVRAPQCAALGGARAEQVVSCAAQGARCGRKAW